MNNVIVADSSGIISLLLKTDQNNERAVSIGQHFQNKPSTVIIPEDIFSESINILGKKFDHEKALETALFILDSKEFLIENTTDSLRRQALKKFELASQSISFTDCIVMVFADHFNTKEIFGFDKVFSQNGYILPISS